MGSTVACIGSGNMGSALMKGIAGKIGWKNIGFADSDAEKAAAAATPAGAKVYRTNVEAAENADYLFLAVKPQVLAVVLAEIADTVKRKKPVLVSMAAGWSISRIQAAVPCSPAVPVVRIMPNTPAVISKGMTAMTASPQVTAEKARELKNLLEGAGTVDIIEEKLVDAVTGLSGSGPAFAYMFIEALADGGVLAGLPRDKALLYAANTVLGSAAMVGETGRHPGALKDEVCSPGGTTIAGIAALESGSFRSSVIGAVQASWRRSLELSGEV